MDTITRNADEIADAMARIWTDPKYRTSMARSFAVRVRALSFEDAQRAYPMGISQVLASSGWTAETFIRSLH